MQSNQPSGKVDAGLASLVMLARYYQVAADSNQLRHHFGTHERPFERSEILRAARHLKLKAKALTTRWDKLGAISLPAMPKQRMDSLLSLPK